MTEQHDTAELVDRARRFAKSHDIKGEPTTAALLRTVADRLETLESRQRVLREALERIEAACPFTPPHPAESEYDFGYQYFNTADDYALHRANRDASSVGDIARRALAGDAP